MLRHLRCSLAVLLLAACAVAHAHGLRVSVQAEADGVRGQAFYSDGAPARREKVALFGADAAAPLAASRTDADGRFHLPLAAAGSYRVVVQGGHGHRAEASFAWAPPPPAVDAAALAAVVRAEMVPLREDLARLEARTRLADLVGGVGIVFGLFGAWAWWRARARR